MNNFRKNNFKVEWGLGFTLIELLVVITVIGIFSTIVMISLSGSQAKARDARRSADVNNLMTVLGQYRENEGKYPACNNDKTIFNCELSIVNFPTALSPYMVNFPKDPKSNVGYQYTRSTDSNSYYIVVEKEASVRCYSGVGTIPMPVCK